MEERQARAESEQAPRGEREAANYGKHWRAFGVRWYAALLLLLSWLPVTGYTLWYCRTVIHSTGTAALVISTLTVLLGTCLWWQGQFRCPRCRRRYAALGNKRGDTNWTLGFFDRTCTNCYLRKFERV